MRKQTCYTTVLGIVLREIREQKNLTQAQLAKSVGISSVGWGKLEKGVSGLSVENLVVASKYLGISPSEILEKTESLIEELQKNGWTVEQKRIDEDGLMAGWDMFKSLSTVAGIAALGVLGAGVLNYKSDILNKSTQGFEAIKSFIKNKI
jgi:transcriptional regulator with XRE-family HTH domain